MSTDIHLYFVILWKLFSYVDGDGNKEGRTLTTASLRPSTSAKPTTIYKRINVERSVENGLSTPLDLLKDQEPRRSNFFTLWNWDTWCQLQPKKGNCIKSLQKYYYDAQLDQCLVFTYTGCNGNKNNFGSIADCERHCKGTVYMPVKENEQQFMCQLQPDAGLCLAFMSKYYYDINQGECKTFGYSGCGGNSNRFDNVSKCLKACHKKKHNKEIE